MYYDDSKTEKLKCKCYVCTKEINPMQSFNYYTSKYKVIMRCCGREEEIELTESQIKLNNETGFYFAFMGIR